LNALFGRILKKLPYPSEQMNRSDLIQLLADRFSQLTQKDAEAAVSTILDTMNNALVRGHRIEIRGFGSFTVIHRAPRLGRNPRSGAAVDIPERRQAHSRLEKRCGRRSNCLQEMSTRASLNESQLRSES